MPTVLTINGGSSSIRFAIFEAGQPPKRLLQGKMERIGGGGASLTVDWRSRLGANRDQGRTRGAWHGDRFSAGLAGITAAVQSAQWGWAPSGAWHAAHGA